MPAPVYLRLASLDDNALRRLAELWRRASELQADKPRSCYHRWAVKAYLELYLRQQRKDNPR